MTIQELKEQNLIVLECISGSKAYGLDVPGSDTDIRGVFVLPQERILGLDYIEQVANPTNDVVYYELGRFLDLLSKNNPNILELIACPEDMMLQKHPIMEALTPDLFLSKKCKYTFAGYALAQIKKARGLNKKIVNPVGKRKKTILEFCYVLQENKAIPLNKWLKIKNLGQSDCGLVNINHAKSIYGIYADPTGTMGYKGIMKKENATTVLLTSVPKNERLEGYLYFNQDGYVKYCKDYKEYWEWVENRNEARYENNLTHGKAYDSKNMMHTFRLLNMALEILESQKIQVRRPDREFLLSIRKGEWQYEDLLAMVEQKLELIDLACKKSLLPEKPSRQRINQLLVDLRSQFYSFSINL